MTDTTEMEAASMRLDIIADITRMIHTAHDDATARDIPITVGDYSGLIATAAIEIRMTEIGPTEMIEELSRYICEIRERYILTN